MARGSVRFDHFHYNRACEATIRRSPQIRIPLQSYADRGRDAARGFAPVGPTDPGSYRDSIESDVYLAADGLRGRFRARDFKSRWIEFGTGGTSPTPAFHVLQRAGYTLGLRWRQVIA